MARHKKKPNIGFSPKPEKKPIIIPSFRKNGNSVLFCFDRFDAASKWIKTSEIISFELWNIFSKLKSFEKKTWTEIAADSSRNHFIPFTGIIPDAQKRAAKMGLDIYDGVWSFSLDGKKRLWGIKDDRFFLVIWWDPHHQICPSRKKHT